MRESKTKSIENVASEVYPRGGRATLNGFYRFTGPSGEVIEGERSFVESYARICEEDREKREVWVAEMRERGIKMAHPDDGWVNRVEDEVMPSYPQFDDGAEVGDLIALGDYDQYRIVKVTGKRQGMFTSKDCPMIYYKFNPPSINNLKENKIIDLIKQMKS